MSRRSKVIAVSMMWVMVSISAFVFFDTVKMRVILYSAACVGTYVVMMLVPKAKVFNDELDSIVDQEK